MITTESVNTVEPSVSRRRYESKTVVTVGSSRTSTAIPIHVNSSLKKQYCSIKPDHRSIASRVTAIQPASGQQHRPIVFRPIRNDEVEKFYWNNVKHQLCSIINADEFFRLTGQDSGKGIVLINGKEFAVVPHKHLKPDEIILNPFCSLTADKTPVQVTSCQKEIQKHKKALITVTMAPTPDGQPHTLEHDKFSNTIKAAAGGLPVGDGQTYSIEYAYTPKEQLGTTEPPFLLKLQFRIDPPEKPETSGDDKKQELSETALNLLDEGEKVELHFKTLTKDLAVEDGKVWTRKVPLRCNLQRHIREDNSIYVSQGLFRSLHRGLNHGEEAVALVKVNDSHYFAVPHYNDEDDSPVVQVNSVFPKQSKTQYSADVLSVEENLSTAHRCQIKLDWHRYRSKAHGLSEQEVESQIRKALKLTPLEHNKRFKVHIHAKEDKLETLCIIEGTVLSVEGAKDGLEGVFRATEETQLQLQAEDASILNGGEPNPRQLDETVQILSEGLSGIEDIADQIARRVVIPYGSEDAERGILLYGPPGTGKTVLAGNIARSFGALKENIRFVNTASVVKVSPANSATELNNLMSPVEYAQKGDNEVYILVFDEIDTMVGTKSMFGSNETQDAIRTTLQVILDGQTPHPNLIVIGTTNKTPDDFDPALLRTNRFSVQIEMGLPNQTQRLALLKDVLNRENTPTPKAPLTEEQLEHIAKATDGSDCALLTHIASQLRGDISKNIKPGDAINRVLFDTPAVRESKKRALKTSQPAFPGTLTANEEKAVLKAVAELEKTATRIGQKAVILIEAEVGARTQLFCHEVLKRTSSFSNYRIVTDGTNMISSTLTALSEAQRKSSSVVVVDHAEKLVTQSNARQDVGEVGQQWTSSIENHQGSTALMLVSAPLPGHSTHNLVTHKIGLPTPRTIISLKAGINAEEMHQTLEACYPHSSQKERERVVSTFADQAVHASRFCDLVQYWKRSDDCWDVDSMKDEYLRSLPGSNSMYI